MLGKDAREWLEMDNKMMESMTRIPLPIHHAAFKLDIKQLEEDRKLRHPLIVLEESPTILEIEITDEIMKQWEEYFNGLQRFVSPINCILIPNPNLDAFLDREEADQPIIVESK